MTDPEWERGAEEFTAVTGWPSPNRGDDYLADVVVDHVFGDIWTRPGLTRKERRWIAISCACMSGAAFAMETHMGAALRTGEITAEELQEFVVHFAVYAGFPAATAARAALDAAVAAEASE